MAELDDRWGDGVRVGSPREEGGDAGMRARARCGVEVASGWLHGSPRWARSFREGGMLERAVRGLEALGNAPSLAVVKEGEHGDGVSYDLLRGWAL